MRLDGGRFGGITKKKVAGCPPLIFPWSNCIVLPSSPNRGKKLDETLVLHEFLREYEDLQDWITQQKQTASSEDYGNDYEHVLVSFEVTNQKSAELQE